MDRGYGFNNGGYAADGHSCPGRVQPGRPLLEDSKRHVMYFERIMS